MLPARLLRILSCLCELSHICLFWILLSDSLSVCHLRTGMGACLFLLLSLARQQTTQIGLSDKCWTQEEVSSCHLNSSFDERANISLFSSWH